MPPKKRPAASTKIIASRDPQIMPPKKKPAASTRTRGASTGPPEPPRPLKSFTELKTWNTWDQDQGWTGNLAGLSWQKSTGTVQETWRWTPPTWANDKDKDKDKDKDERVLDTDKDKGKRTRKDMDNDTSARKGKGKGKGKRARKD